MRRKLEKIVPYVDNLKLGDEDQLGDDDWSTPMYSQCIKFSFDVSMLNNKYKFLDPDGTQCLLPQVYSEMESSWVSSLTN